MKKIRIACIGISNTHVAANTEAFAKFPEVCEIVGAADYPVNNPDDIEVKKQLNFPKTIELKVWDDYKELLKQDIDLALVCAEVSDYAEVCEEILAMNIHVLVEKPMALNMDHAIRMYEAHKKSKAQLMINWPVAWFPCFRKAKEVVESGEIGDILRVQYRSPATFGPYSGKVEDRAELAEQWWYKKEKGGGAMLDYACYGCVLTTWFAGKKAERVSGIKKNFLIPFAEVEDYSTFTLDFGDCVGLLEGSWSTVSNGEIPTGPIIYGSKGVVVADRFDTRVKVYKTFLPYQPSPAPDEVYTETSMEDNLAKNVLDFMLNGAPLFEMLTADFNIKAMAALDAGMRSCESGIIEKCLEV